eukprot:XP_002932551.1 PREDICTED: 5-hydroxytryptamine receptor 3A-like isoform X1 [Xenopus tropicalis]
MTLQFTSLLLSAILLGRAECNRICSLNDVLQNISLASIPGANIRPVKNWQTPSEVFIHVTLYSIVSLDTSSQTLTTYIWLYLKWKNEFISWNPVDFCDIDEVTSLGDTLWKPDLYIYQLVEPDDKNPVIPYYRIQNDGDIVSSKPLRIISSCNINIFKFPFDTQTCNLTFGSFIYTVEDIIMFPSLNSSEVSQLSLDSFVSKGDWSLLDVAVVNQSLVGDGQFSEVTYMITMKRSSVVFVINLIVPACFLIFLDFASMFIRIGETLEFKITIVLGFSVLLLILNDMMPSSDNPPMLGIFCVVCLAIMVISILGCILTNYMLTLSDMQPNVPNWIKTLILKHLARILFFKLYKNEQNLVVSVDTDPGVSKAYNQPDMELQKKKKDSDKEIKITPEARLLKKLLDEVLKINQNLKLSKNEQDAKSEWYMAALVVDRLILFLYLIIVIIIFIVLIIVWAK